MPHWCCATCGVEFPDSPEPPPSCPICADERQYVPKSGQRWTFLEALVEDGHRLDITEVEPDLYGLTVTPRVGIGQQALLVRTDGGNLLWDPTGYVDEDAAATIRTLGGIAIIAASHPHMYGVQSAWSQYFGGAPIVIDARDRQWVQREDPAIRTLGDGDGEILPGVTLRRIGGHFAGSLVAHWDAPDGAGVVLSGDGIFPNPDGTRASFLRSYPNNLPLSARVARRIAATVAERPFDRLYGNFGGSIDANARSIVVQSAEWYAAWVNGEHDDET